MSKRCPRDVQEMSKRCPRDVQEMSKRCPRDVQEMSKRCPRDVQEMSKRCARDVLSAHHLHSQVIQLRIRHLRKKERKLVPVFLWYTNVKRDRVEATIPQPADNQLDYRAGKNILDFFLKTHLTKIFHCGADVQARASLGTHPREFQSYEFLIFFPWTLTILLLWLQGIGMKGRDEGDPLCVLYASENDLWAGPRTLV